MACFNKDRGNSHLRGAIRGWQGVVYGVATEETMADAALINRYDYDGIFGTRAQPLRGAGRGRPPADRVRASGGQTRGYLDIRDTVRCCTAAQCCSCSGSPLVVSLLRALWPMLHFGQSGDQARLPGMTCNDALEDSLKIAALHVT